MNFQTTWQRVIDAARTLLRSPPRGAEKPPLADFANVGEKRNRLEPNI